MYLYGGRNKNPQLSNIFIFAVVYPAFQNVEIITMYFEKKINKISDSKRAQMNENHLLYLGRSNTFFN